MIDIQFNGNVISIPDGISLNDLLKEKEYQENTFAVAVNECFVPRSQLTEIIISAGDRIEVVTAMQGG